MTRAALVAAIEAVEKAAEGSRELSDMILLAVGWRQTPYEWTSPAGKVFVTREGGGSDRPDPSQSLDAAVTYLVDPGERFYLRRSFRLNGIPSWYASVADISAVKSTVALAACLAGLRAQLTMLDAAP